MAAFDQDLEDQIASALGSGTAGAQAASSDPFELAAKQYHVPASILRGMYKVESNNGQRLQSSAGAQGPMGLMPVLQKKYGVTDPNDLSQAVPAAAQYLREGLDKHGGDLGQALQYYHGGPDEKIWGPLTAQYPGQIYAASHGKNFDSSDIDAGLASLKPESAAQAPQSVASPAPVAPWGEGNSIINGITLGAGPYLSAGISTARDMIAPNNKLSLSQNYQNELTAQKAGRADFNAANPVRSAVSELGGSAASSVPLMMAGGAGVDALGARAAVAAPGLEPVVSGLSRFLGGSAGADTDGIGGWLLRRASQGASGAVQGTTAAGLQSGLDTKSEGDSLGTGAGVGAAVNMAVSPVVGALARPFTSVLTPQVAKLGQKLQDLGVNIPGWALSPDTELRNLGQKYAPITTDLHSDWTKALAKTAGADSNVLDQSTIQTALANSGKRLDAASLGSDIPLDGPLLSALPEIHSNIMGNELVTPAVQSTVDKLHNDIVNRFLQHDGDKLGFTLPGSDYQDLMSSKGRIGQLLNSKDPYAQQAGRAYQGAFWDALDRSYPGETSEWQAARTQYKNAKVLQDAAEKAGPNGVPTPQNLMSSVLSHYPNYGATGAGDIGALAEGGKFLPKLDVQGNVKPASGFSIHPPEGMLKKLGFMALGAEGLKDAFHSALPIAENHPIGATASLVGIGGAAMAKNAVGKYLASQKFTDDLIQRSLAASGSAPSAGFINPLIPLASGANNQ